MRDGPGANSVSGVTGASQWVWGAAAIALAALMPVGASAQQEAPVPGEAPVAEAEAAEVEDIRRKDEVMIVEGEATRFRRALDNSQAFNEFFSDERFEDEINYTRVRLRANAFFREGQGADLDPQTRVRIRLPGAKRRFNLLLSGDFDDALGLNNEEDPLQEDLKNLLEPEESEDGSLALQTFLAATEQLNISVQTGVRLRNATPVAFIGPRYRQTFDLDPWLLRITQQVRWFSDDGFAIRSALDFERELAPKFQLRITPNADWSQDDEEIAYGVNIRLYHDLGPDHALRYDLTARIETEPVHQADRFIARVRYRRRLLGTWLYGEIAPELAFPRDRDFDLTPGILLRIDTIFSHSW